MQMSDYDLDLTIQLAISSFVMKYQGSFCVCPLPMRDDLTK